MQATRRLRRRFGDGGEDSSVGRLFERELEVSLRYNVVLLSQDVEGMLCSG